MRIECFICNTHILSGKLTDHIQSSHPGVIKSNKKGTYQMNITAKGSK